MITIFDRENNLENFNFQQNTLAEKSEKISSSDFAHVDEPHLLFLLVVWHYVYNVVRLQYSQTSLTICFLLVVWHYVYNVVRLEYSQI